MAQAAIPILAGTGLQIIGASQGWDPRLTALASIAAGGVGAGLTSGAFAGGTAAQAAIAPTATGAVWNPTTVGQGLASSAIPSAASSAVPSAASFAVPGGEAGRVLGGMNYTQNISPAYSAVAEVKAPFFDRTQYKSVERPYTAPDGTQGVQTVKMPVYDDNGNIVKGMSQADSLGVNMLDTFMQYELALAQQPKPRPTRSGGGGGGGGGGPAASYQGGGGGSGQKQVTWGFGGGNNNGYQPQGLV